LDERTSTKEGEKLSVRQPWLAACGQYLEATCRPLQRQCSAAEAAAGCGKACSAATGK